MSDQAVADRRVESITTDRLPRRVPLPAVAQTLWSVFGMDSFVRFCLVRYPAERMLSLRIVGVGYVVSVLDPQLVREVFSGDGEVLRGGEANAQALGMLGPNSLLLLDGEPHLHAGGCCCPRFTARRCPAIPAGRADHRRGDRSLAPRAGVRDLAADAGDHDRGDHASRYRRAR